MKGKGEMIAKSVFMLPVVDGASSRKITNRHFHVFPPQFPHIPLPH